jgi:hypothetical protein
LCAPAPNAPRSLHDRLRGNARADNARHALRAQLGFERGRIKRAHAVLDDLQVFFAYFEIGVNFRAPFADLEEARSRRTRENRRMAWALLIVRTEAHAHEAHQRTGRACLL